MTVPVVAIVGRPNVGKSTLVNRIIGAMEAIVQERPGVTRDRVVYTAEWQGKPFVVLDTGGLEESPSGELAEKVAQTARAAAEEADIVAFVVDVTAGITPADHAVADVIRRLGRPTLLIANKSDNRAREEDAIELYSLGMGEPHPVSALHGRGVGDLLDALTKDFTAIEPPEHPEPGIAIVGRPNVGKSTLFNRMVGEERSIVHDEPGTTRDAVDTVVEIDGEMYRFVDTAGLRRQIRVDDPTEFYGTVRTMRAIERSELVLMVIDATEGIARQDLRIAEQLAEHGRSAIVLLNKMDLLEPALRKIEVEEVRRRMPYLDFAPVMQISAHTGSGIGEIMPVARRILAARSIRVPTPLLNGVVEDLQSRHPIPSRTRTTRVKYVVQAESNPPVVVLFGASHIPERWLKYLERGLRKRFGFEGTPIRFVTRGSERRAAGSKR